MYLTDMYSDGIAILPYHRVVKPEGGMSPARVLDVLSPWFDVSREEYAPGAATQRLISKKYRPHPSSLSSFISKGKSRAFSS